MIRRLIFVLAACGTAGAVEFGEVKAIFEKHCLACHAKGKAAGGLALDSRQAMLKATIPGEPDKSSLIRVVELSPSARGAMPPGGPQLPEASRAALRAWVADGAKWPEGLTLEPAKAPKLDEKQLVEALHKRITARTREQSASEMKPYKEPVPGSDVAFEMIPIPGGEFAMGSDNKGESPVRQVTVSPFWMGAREVTWDEYRLFMFAQQSGEAAMADLLVDAVARPTKPYVEMSFGMGINGFPAISMTHHAANKYAQWVSARTGHFYRLPTEAEWEYACKAGKTEASPESAWFNDNSNDKYQTVGTKKPNGFGLYDMLGNVTEWTLDQYGPYNAGAVKDPVTPSKTPYPHAARGGSWADSASQLRCSARVASDPTWKQQDPQLPKSIWYLTDAQWLGLRLVRPLKIPDAREMYRAWNNGVERE